MDKYILIYSKKDLYQDILPLRSFYRNLYGFLIKIFDKESDLKWLHKRQDSELLPKPHII